MITKIEPRDWLIALHHIEGIGRKTLTRAIPLFQTPEFNPDHLISSLLTSPFITSQRKSDMQKLTLDQVIHIKKTLHHMNIHTITTLDELYPLSLKEIHDPPVVLYAIGNLKLLKLPMLAIVGTRTPTSYGRQVAYRLAYSLGNLGMCITSGLARGIDGEAHKGALQTTSGTIAILGCGIDVIYPTQHQRLYRDIADKGLVLSEYPPGTAVQKGLFPERNRLISGLSLGVIVVEAASKSGSLITAAFALEHGRDVFAVPGSILSAQSLGPHKLIKDGAIMITDLADIINEYKHMPLISALFQINQEKNHQLTVNQIRILDIIDNKQVSMEYIYQQSASIPVKDVLSDLMQLKLKGLVKRLPGPMYTKVSD